MLVSALPSSDLDRIASVWHAALTSLPRTSVAALRQRLQGDLAACHAAFVRDDSQIVAFAIYDLQQRWLRQLFVHPGFQGTGLGTQLLATTMQAMPQGWLRTDAGNEPAQRFYRRRGLRVRRRGPHPDSGLPTVEFEWP
jgi:ribosomal protein S18 acetylase RimI-like enzyme